MSRRTLNFESCHREAFLFNIALSEPSECVYDDDGFKLRRCLWDTDPVYSRWTEASPVMEWIWQRVHVENVDVDVLEWHPPTANAAT